MKDWRHMLPYMVLIVGLAATLFFYNEHRNSQLRQTTYESCLRGNTIRAELTVRQPAFVGLFDATIQDHFEHGHPEVGEELTRLRDAIKPIPPFPCETILDGG